MPFPHYERLSPRSTATVNNTISLRRSHMTRVLAYTVALSCVLGVLQSSITGVSAAPALSGLVRSEGLDVVGIGGSLRAVDSDSGLFNAAKEPRQGLVFGKRHAKAEAQTAVDNIQNGAEPTTLLAENATRDQSETASPTSTPTRDQKEKKAPEAPAAQSTVETAGGSGDQTIPSTTTGPTGPSTKSPVSENPDASLQSSPSATQETNQEPTKNANNSQSTTNEEPISPTPSSPVPTQVLSLVAPQPVETPTTTPPTETSPKQTPGKSYTHLRNLKKKDYSLNENLQKYPRPR